MPYQIYLVGRGVPAVLVSSRIYESIEEANLWAASEAISPPYAKAVARPVRETSEDWKARETARFASGHYVKTIWHDETWWNDGNERFAHVSRDFPGKIAFTESALRGASDIKSTMRPGRYLQTFYPVLADPQIKAESIRFNVAVGGHAAFHILRETADIVKAYRNGPESCMAHPTRDYNSSVHPVSAYGDSDLGLAVLFHEDYSIESDDWRIIARAIVWPDRKIFWRVYGTSDIRQASLREHLETLGYTRQQSFHGAKMRRIEEGDSLVMPYLDIDQSFDDCGDYILLTVDGQYTAGSTGGLISIVDEKPCCDRCGDRVDEDETTTIITSVRYHNTESWCDHCRENEAWYSEHLDRYYSGLVESVTINGSDLVPERWFEDHGFTCTECNENHLDRDIGGETDTGSACDDCAGAMHEHSDGVFRNDEEETDDTGAPIIDSSATNPDQIALEGI